MQIAPIYHNVVARLRKRILRNVSAGERNIGLLKLNLLALCVDTSARADTENKSYDIVSARLVFNFIIYVAYGTREDIKSVKQKRCGEGERYLGYLVFKGVYRA